MAKTQSVFIVGATGKTGESIANALLADPSFHVIAAIRPASASKPQVADLKARGAEIIIIDLERASVDQISELFKGVDTVISTLVYSQLDLQKPLIHAAKKAGVKRFVPDDWATPCIPGVRGFYDQKATYHDLIKEVGLGYTFIDVGWWFQNALPIIDPAKEPFPGFADVVTRTLYGSGEIKSAFTDLRDIGKFTARIIADERTLNHYVFVHGEESTQKEVIALAKRVSGRDLPIKEQSAESLTKQANEATGDLQILLQYLNSIYVRGDNTIENAKKTEYGGALDARELYPDLQVASLADFAKEYYSS